MPKNILADYDSTTADNNTDIGGISIAEGMLPSAVNNSIRELTKQLGAMADGTDALTALSVDNLKLDGNTLSSTDTNGDINLTPNGTGDVTVTGTVAATAYTGDGSALTGISSVGGATGVSFNDSVKAQFGAGNDLEILHDGTDSWIREAGSGTGSIKIRANNLLAYSNSDEPYFQGVTNGAFRIYYDGSAKLTTTSIGVSVIGTIAADTLTHSTAGSLTTDYVVNGSAKQWSYVNDTGASAIIDSFNTTSWTDNGTGNGTVNIASNMSNATYNISVSTNADNGGRNRACGLFTGTSGTTSTSGLYRISRWIITANSLEDGYFYSSTLGDLA